MAVRVTQQSIEVLGRTDVVASVEAGSIPDLVEIFLHNWQSTFTIQNAWSTDVTIAVSLEEERRGLVDRPYRKVRVRWSGLSQTESARILQAALRSCHQELPLPLACDAVRLSAGTAIGATVIPCSPGDRRFFVGARVVIHDWDADRRPANIEFAVIAAVGESSITVATPLTLAHVARGRVMPVIETEVNLEAAGTILTRHVSDFSIDFDEIPGPSALPPWSDGWNDTPCDTYRGIPILCLNPDWTVSPQVSIRRAGDRTRQGRANVTDLRGHRPRLGFDLSLTGLNRASGVEILRFLDSRRGRLRAFWMVNPAWLWRPVAISTTDVTIATAGNADDVRRFFEWVGLVYQDRKTIVRGLDDLVETEDGWQLVFSEPIPSDRATLACLRAVTSGHLVRLESDAINEEWTTDTILQTKASMVELGKNETTRIARFDEAIPFVSPDTIPDLFLWLEAPDEMRAPGGALVAIDGDQIEEWKDKRMGVTRALRTDVPPQEQHHEYYSGATLVARFTNYSVIGKGELVLSEATPIFSNVEGLTVLIALQQQATTPHPTDDDFILHLDDAIHWTPTTCRFYEDPAVDDDDHVITTSDVTAPRAVPHVIALVWKPGQLAQVYQDGHLRGEMPVPVVDLPKLSGESAKAHFLRFANNAMDLRTDDDGWCDSILVFDRALSIDELNRAGYYLSLLVGTTWRKVT